MVERSAELRVGVAIDADVRANAKAALDLSPPRVEFRSVECHALSDNRSQSTTGFEPEQRLFNVPRSKLRVVPMHAATGRREGRIHDDRVVQPIWRQKVIEPFGIDCGRREALYLQEATPTWVDFVRIDSGAGAPCEDGNVARSSARLQDLHAGTHGSRADDQERLRRGRAELLKLDLRRVAASLAGHAALQLGERLHRAGHVEQVKLCPGDANVHPRLRRVVHVPRVTRRMAEAFGRELVEQPVVDTGLRLVFEYSRDPPREGDQAER